MQILTNSYSSFPDQVVPEEVKDSELIPKNRKTDGYGLAGQESKY